MNGERAVLSVKMIRKPNKRSITIIGSSQNFFLTRKNAQKSFIVDALLIGYFTNKNLPSTIASISLP